MQPLSGNPHLILLLTHLKVSVQVLQIVLFVETEQLSIKSVNHALKAGDYSSFFSAEKNPKENKRTYFRKNQRITFIEELAVYDTLSPFVI